jgi:hypothetical protein
MRSKQHTSGWLNDDLNYIELESWELTRSDHKLIYKKIKELSKEFPFFRFHLQVYRGYKENEY